jgi:serine/threonine protein kinase
MRFAPSLNAEGTSVPGRFADPRERSTPMSPDSLLRGQPDELLRKAASELRQHLETGQDYHAETVLNAFPSLASDPHRALELIVLEFQVRRELGQNPDPHDWYERFPQWRDELRERLEALPSAEIASSQRETAALGTAPYPGAKQPTVVDIPANDPPLLGRHEILEEIGRGGMGVVYRARDLVLERMVALKVIRSGNLASSVEVHCFYREARSAARLRHPNIVPIYGMGLHDGQHCFTMPLFSRGSLSQHIQDYRQDIRAAVALTAKAARAVHAAHERGIIHRDLKPGNILLDERGEPVVSDFGLAKQVDVSATLSLAENPIGTPAYMSPEQARCEAATAASDIWSLGVILYELLTGRRPFSGDSSEVVKQRVLQADPVSPRRLRSDLPRDLETIVLKCLNKEPKRRYDSAAELADELERWLAGEPIRARPESRWQRLQRVFRRRVGMKGVMVLLLMSAAAAGFWGILSYFSPEARERRRQEQVLASIQRELAEGRSVTLVGPLGPPKWYRWRTNRDRPPLPELRKWPLKLEPVGACSMLELLPDPQQASYRFSAEVNPSLTDNSSELGLYFACEEIAMPTGSEQCFGLFRLIVHGMQVTKAELCLVGYYEQDVNEDAKCFEFTPPFKFKPVIFPLAPAPLAAGEEKKPWLRVEVIVRSDEIQAFCDGCLSGDFSLLAQRMTIPMVWQPKRMAPFPYPTFPVRGGLGLYANGGPARFRNVVVEPLLEQ